MGIKESPRPETVYNNATLISHVANYCKGAAMTAAEVDAQLRCQNNSSWLSKEELQLITSAYLTKAEALTNLHVTLGYMPYSRIEKLI